MKGRIVPGVSALALLAYAAPLAAQTAVLEEIVVTARKQEENLQTTPVSVSALGSEAIEQLQINTVFSLGEFVPNLVTSTNGAGEGASFIRGVGIAEPLLTLDPPNGLYVDGVYQARNAGSISEVVDLERVEVLRGPQGTLFGRNTTGGAVLLSTARPADEAGGKQVLSFGNYGWFKTRTTLDTGLLGDSGLQAKLSFVHYDRNGTQDNVLEPKKGRDPGAKDADAVHLRARWTPKGQNGFFDYIFYHNKQSARVPAFQLAGVRADVAAYLSQSPAAGGVTPVISGGRLDSVALDYDGPQSDKIDAHTLTAEFELGDVRLRSITGYRQWDNSVKLDLDGNGVLRGVVANPPGGIADVTLFRADNTRHQKQLTQEVDLFGSVGERLTYVVGAYYFWEKSDENNAQRLTSVLAQGAAGFLVNTNLTYGFSSESVAGFGQLQWNPAILDDRLRLTAGLRYTHDEKQLGQVFPVLRSGRRTFQKATWSSSADFTVAEGVLAYARVSTGHNAGGFNPRGGATVDPSYAPEKLTSYEAGVKSEWLDKRLRVNLSGFYSDYKDIQVTQFVAGTAGAASVTVNAGAATIKGIEAEATALLAPGLTLNGSLGLTDPDYDRFLFRDPATNALVDVAGQARFGHVSKVTAAAGVQYAVPVADLTTLVARVDWTYQSKRYWHALDSVNPFNELIRADSRNLWHARLAATDIRLPGVGADLEAAFWVRNLTNAKYRIQGIDFGALGFAGVRYGEPRTWGVDLTVKF